MTETVADNSDDSGVTISIESLLQERHSVRVNTSQQPTGTGQWAGNFRGSRRGHGTDFDDLRHYSTGDEIRHIDWKAFARTNTLHTRLYREEREHRVTLIVDLRSSMFTGSTELRSVRASLTTAHLLWQAVAGESRCRLLCVSDTGVHASEYSQGHQAAIGACALLERCFMSTRNQIDGTHAATSSTTRETHQQSSASVFIRLAAISPSDGPLSPVTFDRLAHWLIGQPRLHGTLIWVSAFDHLGTGFNETLQTLTQATSQVAVYVNDAMLEQGLPAGHYAYRAGKQSDRSSQSVSISHRQRHQLQQLLTEQKQQRIARFSKLLIPLLDTDSGHPEIVSFLRQRGYMP